MPLAIFIPLGPPNSPLPQKPENRRKISTEIQKAAQIEYVMTLVAKVPDGVSNTVPYKIKTRFFIEVLQHSITMNHSHSFTMSLTFIWSSHPTFNAPNQVLICSE